MISIALAIACICLSGWFLNPRVGTVLFMLGMAGGMCMILLTGVHGDFNAAGGVAYVLVNTLVFYGLIKLAILITNRVRNG